MKEFMTTEEIEQQTFHKMFTWKNFIVWLKQNNLALTWHNLIEFRNTCWVLTFENEEEEIKVFKKVK